MREQVDNTDSESTDKSELLPKVSFDLITKIIGASTSIGFLILLRYCAYIHYFPTSSAQDLAFLLPGLAATGFVFFATFVGLVYVPTIMLSPYVERITNQTGQGMSAPSQIPEEMQKKDLEDKIVMLNLRIYTSHFFVIIAASLLTYFTLEAYLHNSNSPAVIIIAAISITTICSLLAAHGRLHILRESKKEQQHLKKDRFLILKRIFMNGKKTDNESLKSAKHSPENGLEAVFSLVLAYCVSLSFNAMFLFLPLIIPMTMNARIGLMACVLLIIALTAVIGGTSNAKVQTYAFYGVCLIMLIFVFGPATISIACMNTLGIGGIPNVSLVTDKTGSDITTQLFGVSRISDDHFAISPVYLELNLGSVVLVSDRAFPPGEATQIIQIPKASIVSISRFTNLNGYNHLPATLIIAGDEQGEPVQGVLIPNTGYALITITSSNSIQLQKLSLLSNRTYILFSLKNPRKVFYDDSASILDKSSINKYFMDDKNVQLNINRNLLVKDAIDTFEKDNKAEIDFLYSNIPQSP